MRAFAPNARDEIRGRVAELQARRAQAKLNDSTGVRIRQRTQQQPIYDREDRRARADSEREREHRDAREPRVLVQLAASGLEILQHRQLAPNRPGKTRAPRSWRGMAASYCLTRAY